MTPSGTATSSMRKRNVTRVDKTHQTMPYYKGSQGRDQMSITQIETLLTEATTKYLKTGEGKEDVAMYARLLYVATHTTKENN